MISLIDIGISNLGSLSNALKRIDVEFNITSDIKNISNSKGIIIPGVGSFYDGMKSLDKLNLLDNLKEISSSGIPILGICLGMQLLANTSEEFGSHLGLGLVPGDVKKLNNTKISRVPNIGWHDVYLTNGNHLFSNINDGASFYFVHSYAIQFNKNVDCLGHIRHGNNDVIGFFQYKNIFGAQFHPEKSQDNGLQFLSNFTSFCINRT